jgi:NAD(P)H-hydrate epimerase
MKQYDSNTTEHFKIPSLVLMERAAVAFTEMLRENQVDCRRVLVVCGSGNNGGDGLAIGRILALGGCDTDIVLLSATSGYSKENKAQQDILKAYDIAILEQIPENTVYTLVIDALFGVGLSRNTEGKYEKIIEQMNRLTGQKVAVDIASGISSDNGSILGTAFRADMTITFSYEKIGQLLWPGNQYSGRVLLAKIGIEDRSFLGKTPSVSIYERTDLLQLAPRESHSNKGTFGKMLLIAGSVNMAGAAILAAKAAYAAGVGLVRIVTPEENRIMIQTSVPEAILTTYSAKKPEQTLLLEAMKWADVIVCGPGIGLSEAARVLVRTVLSSAAVPVLLDADALNLIAEDTGILLKPHTDMVLTPHLGEMSRLTKDSVTYIQSQLISVAEEFARQYNIVCVLKDEHTITSVPYRQTYLNMSGNSGMAVAGSGDVLSGVIGSLMAQGMSAEKAAPLGVYLHGCAGDIMAGTASKRGMVASDIIEGIRQVAVELEKMRG